MPKDIDYRAIDRAFQESHPTYTKSIDELDEVDSYSEDTDENKVHTPANSAPKKTTRRRRRSGFQKMPIIFLLIVLVILFLLASFVPVINSLANELLQKLGIFITIELLLNK